MRAEERQARVDRVLVLAGQGLTCDQIVGRLGGSTSAIRDILKRHGKDAQTDREEIGDLKRALYRVAPLALPWFGRQRRKEG